MPSTLETLLPWAFGPEVHQYDCHHSLCEIAKQQFSHVIASEPVRNSFPGVLERRKPVESYRTSAAKIVPRRSPLLVGRADGKSDWPSGSLALKLWLS
jgi:hypothetical protein